LLPTGVFCEKKYSQNTPFAGKPFLPFHPHFVTQKCQVRRRCSQAAAAAWMRAQPVASARMGEAPAKSRQKLCSILWTRRSVEDGCSPCSDSCKLLDSWAQPVELHVEHLAGLDEVTCRYHVEYCCVGARSMCEITWLGARSCWILCTTTVRFKWNLLSVSLPYMIETQKAAAAAVAMRNTLAPGCCRGRVCVSVCLERCKSAHRLGRALERAPIGSLQNEGKTLQKSAFAFLAKHPSWEQRGRA
jgi:hypothetical protein